MSLIMIKEEGEGAGGGDGVRNDRASHPPSLIGRRRHGSTNEPQEVPR